jgi:ribosomal protein S18 acetylase RimI-like enzyme
MVPHPQLGTKEDLAEILLSLGRFWGERDVAHLHHPMAVEEFGDSALVIRDAAGRVAAYLFGMVVTAKRLGYVHVVAVRDDERNLGHGRRLYEAFTALAAGRGCTKIKAITTPENVDSIAFHESLGMRAVEVADYSGPGCPRVVLLRDLRSAPGVFDSTTADLVLRIAAPDDVEQILDFWRLAAEDTDRPLDRREAVERVLDRDATALLLALHHRRIVGCVVAGWDGWRAHLYRLAVHPDHRRQGLAAAAGRRRTALA